MPNSVRPRPKVLIVDDNATLLTAVARYLRRRGLQVVTSDSPIGVRALILEHEPDVVILDVMMPFLDGGRLAHMIQESSAAIKSLIFYSAIDEEELYRIAREVPRCTYVSKTEGAEALYTAVCAARRPAA